MLGHSLDLELEIALSAGQRTVSTTASQATSIKHKHPRGIVKIFSATKESCDPGAITCGNIMT